MLNQFSNLSCYEEFEIQCALTGISKIDVLKKIGRVLDNYYVKYYFFVSEDGIFNWFDLNGNHIENPGVLKSIYSGYIPKTLTKCIIPDGVVRIMDGTFSYYKSLKEVIIPNSVIVIYSCAFANYRYPIHISENDIKTIIDSSEKKRFEISNGKIRATYGHSTKSRIEFSETVPPDILYHGTSHKVIDNIRHEGLRPMNRQYVHLSSDFKTARIVGSRHDKNPIILTVDSKRMYLDGFKFFHSANDGTWMCEKVAPEYIIFKNTEY